MRITLNELNHTPNCSITLVEVLSLEGQRYMATLHMGGQAHLLSDPEGHTLLFRSSWEIKDALSQFHPRRVVIIHPSAYNEMIGMDPEPVEPMQIEIQRR